MDNSRSISEERDLDPVITDKDNCLDSKVDVDSYTKATITIVTDNSKWVVGTSFSRITTSPL